MSGSEGAEASAKHAWVSFAAEQEVNSIIEEMSRAHGSDNVNMEPNHVPSDKVPHLDLGSASVALSEDTEWAKALNEGMGLASFSSTRVEVDPDLIPIYRQSDAPVEMRNLATTVEELLAKQLEETHELLKKQHQNAIDVVRRCAGLRSPSMASVHRSATSDILSPSRARHHHPLPSKLAAAVAQVAEDAEGGKKLGPLSVAAIKRKCVRSRTVPAIEISVNVAVEPALTGVVPVATTASAASSTRRTPKSSREEAPSPEHKATAAGSSAEQQQTEPQNQQSQPLPNVVMESEASAVDSAKTGDASSRDPASPESEPQILDVVSGRTSKSTEDNFQVLDVWSRRKKARKKLGSAQFRNSGGSTSTKNSGRNSMTEIDSTSDRTSGSSRCVAHPYDWKRGFWDMVSLILVIHDMAYIPLQFFDPPETSNTQAMAWFTRVFWTLDMPASFFTGFVTVDGFIELRLDRIAKRYLYSWLALDVVIVSIDWLELAFYENSSLGLARMGKATRTFRIIRMLRLLRLARMRQVMVVLTERLRSEKVVVIFDIIRLVVFMISFAHFVACFWYGVGVAHGEEGATTSWVYMNGLETKGLHERYAVSLHWSIAQFAGGMDEVTPEHYLERLFAIAAFLLGFVVAAWFVSSLTSSMTQLNIIGSDKTQQLSALRVYLNQNGITHKLALRVQRNAQHALVEQQRAMPESNVELLQLVSIPLQVEIHLQMYTPHLSNHPFFYEYIEVVPQVMRKVCHMGAQISSISAGDVVFSAGEIPSEPKMYVVISGMLAYNRGVEEVKVTEREWIAEHVLWTEWVHLGDLISTVDCRLCVLDAVVFQRLAMNFDHTDSFLDPAEYAAQFVATLNLMKGVELSDLGVDCRVSSRPSRRSTRRASHVLSPEYLAHLSVPSPQNKIDYVKDWWDRTVRKKPTEESEVSSERS